MYHIKNDQRAIRSSQMLYDALVVLMGQKKFEQIKVSDLVKEAGVGRATFYRNFDTIEDVLRMRCDQTIDGWGRFGVFRRLGADALPPTVVAIMK